MSYGTAHVVNMVNSLFDGENKRLVEQMTDIIEENHKLGNPKDGFLFHGEFCTTLPRKQQAQADKKLLHSELHDQARSFFVEKSTVQKEMQRVHQGLTVILVDCHDDQDIRDMLPDLAIPMLPSSIAALPRTREPGYAVKSHPIKYSDFQHVCDLIGFYVANKLFY